MAKIRLIDANALFDDLKSSAMDAKEWMDETQDEEIKIRAEQTLGTFVEFALRVKAAPTIEAEPVRKGRWVDWSMWGKSNYQCSECDCEMKYRTNYCPRCGAKMDGGAEK